MRYGPRIYTRGLMWRRLRSNPVLLWTLLLAVLAVRIGDTHLHLCFDGLEPATSIHFADASVHHDDEHHESETHADQDVNPFVGTLVKSDDDSRPVFAYIVGVLLIIQPVLEPSALGPIDPAPLSDTSPPFHLRPPLRGPPA